jgi:HAD superfamily hydrolase (TIGR01450 family)
VTAPALPARTVLVDLDGVVWLSGVPIDGAADAIARLRAEGRRVLFVTNNSHPLVVDHEEALAAIGVRAAGDVVTSAQAAAVLVQPGARVLVCGGPGIREALERRRAVPLHAPGRDGVDAVVVGFHRDFDYDRMRVAADAVRAGARLIGTNDDATYPTPHGPIPGGGAILASVAVASGATPEIAGKPYEPMAALVRETLGAAFDAAATIVVGDRPDTDGRFARALGCRFALVRSGVTPVGAPVAPAPELDAVDLGTLVPRIDDRAHG